MWTRKLITALFEVSEIALQFEPRGLTALFEVSEIALQLEPRGQTLEEEK
jgi:hypothetical protein